MWTPYAPDCAGALEKTGDYAPHEMAEWPEGMWSFEVSPAEIFGPDAFLSYCIEDSGSLAFLQRRAPCL